MEYYRSTLLHQPTFVVGNFVGLSYPWAALASQCDALTANPTVRASLCLGTDAYWSFIAVLSEVVDMNFPDLP